MKIEKLSASSIELYRQCPYKFKQSIEKKLPDAPNIYLVFGEYLHEVLELFYKEHFLDSTFDSFKRMEDIYISLRDKYCAKHPDMLAKMPEGKELLSSYYNKYLNGKSSKAILVEHKFLMDLGFVKVSGKIDRIDRDMLGPKVIDYKTGKEKKGMVKGDIQLGIYALSCFEMYPQSTSVRTAWHYLRTKEIQDTFYKSDIDSVKKDIHKVYSDITADELCDPKTSWLCKYCEINSTCPAMNTKPADEIFMKMGK